MVLVVTTEQVPGREIAQTIGLVHVSAVRSRHVGSDIGAALKGLVGGRIGGYEKLLQETRALVLDDLRREAERLGADAVVCMRLATSDVMSTASEIMAYGTAVRLKGAA